MSPTEDTFTSTVDGAAGHARQFAVDDYDDRPRLSDLAEPFEGELPNCPTDDGHCHHPADDGGEPPCCVCDAEQPCENARTRPGADPRGEDACPECPDGIVESVGRMERETGHQPYACNAGCGYYG
ncbi:MAG: hypothetical protein NVS3B1_06160 [Marmoricola sp.]